LAGGFLSVATAAGAIGTALRFVGEETEKAKGSMQQLSGARRSIVQVAESEEDMAAMEARADELAAQWGVKREVALNLVFSARSEEFEPALQKIFASRFVADPTAAAGIAGQLPQLFKADPLKPLEAINAVLVGAQKSRVNFERLAASIPSAAEGGALAEADPAETIGSISVLAARFKSEQVAADRFKALATKISLGPTAGEADEEYNTFVRAQAGERLRTILTDTTVRETMLGEKGATGVEDLTRGINVTRQIEQFKSLTAGGVGIQEAMSRALLGQESVEGSVWKETIEGLTQAVTVPMEERKPMDLRGMGVIDAVKRLSQASEEERSTFLGTAQDLNVAYSVILQEMDVIEERARQVQQAIDKTGTAESALARGSRIALSPETGLGRRNLAQLKMERAAIGREIANEEQYAKKGAEVQAAIDTELSELKREGRSGFSQAAGQIAGTAAEKFRASPHTTSVATRHAAEFVESRVSPEGADWAKFVGPQVGFMAGWELIQAGRDLFGGESEEAQLGEDTPMRRAIQRIEEYRPPPATAAPVLQPQRLPAGARLIEEDIAHESSENLFREQAIDIPRAGQNNREVMDEQRKQTKELQEHTKLLRALVPGFQQAAGVTPSKRAQQLAELEAAD